MAGMGSGTAPIRSGHDGSKPGSPSRQGSTHLNANASLFAPRVDGPPLPEEASRFITFFTPAM